MNQYKVKAKVMMEKKFTVFSDNVGRVREIAKNAIMHTDLVKFTEEDVTSVEAEIWKKNESGEVEIPLSRSKGEDLYGPEMLLEESE